MEKPPEPSHKLTLQLKAIDTNRESFGGALEDMVELTDLRPKLRRAGFRLVDGELEAIDSGTDS